MKYLSPEIAALSENCIEKSLVRPNVSCGIFQDCEPHEARSKLYYEQHIEKP